LRPTRVKIITGYETRQHGLSRGAFCFVNKPATTEGLETALARIKEYCAPRKKRLLIVEDDPLDQVSVKELLAGDDIEILTASTGSEALAMLKERPIDCVVLDLVLPDISGYGV